MKKIILILSMILLGMTTSGNNINEKQDLSGESNLSESSDSILTRIPDWETGIDEIESRYGESISSGDLNGDGFDDVAVGAPAYDTVGAVFIYYGSSSGPSIVPDKIINGSGTGFGVSISCEGDVNNDGYSDLIIGDTDDEGHVHSYHGSATGIKDTADWISNSYGAGNFGSDVSSGGDVNGDGYDDLMASVHEYIIDSLHIGALVFLGSADGFTDTAGPSWTASFPYNPGGNLGLSVSITGDVNGDGFDDALMSASSNENYVLDTNGKVLLYYGSLERQMFDPADVILKQDGFSENFGKNLSIVKDVNNDGFDEIAVTYYIILNGNTNIYFGSHDGPTSNNYYNISGSRFDPTDINTAGDFNNDGFNDVIFQTYSLSETNVFFGIPNGLFENPYKIGGSRGKLASGDVNGDGISDVLVSSLIDYSLNQPRAYGFFGSSNRVEYLTFTPNDTIISNTDELCIGTLVQSQYGLPMSGISVNYIVKGANIISGNSLSDSIGISRFCYTSQSSGRDTIISFYEGISDTAFVVWDYPLPVELSTFNSSVTGRNVTLSWSTNSELNNSGFDIERLASQSGSAIKNEWSKAGFVNGNGTNTEPVNYTFTDKNLLTGKYKYRLKQIDFNGNFEYFELTEEVSIGIPDKFELSQNYPNPFNPVTNLEFGISELGFVSLKIYDVTGRELVTLVNEVKEPGYYRINFNAGNLSSGVYFYRLVVSSSNSMITENFSAVKKMVVLK
jgi:hypothetical protein